MQYANLRNMHEPGQFTVLVVRTNWNHRYVSAIFCHRAGLSLNVSKPELASLLPRQLLPCIKSSLDCKLLECRLRADKFREWWSVFL